MTRLTSLNISSNLLEIFPPPVEAMTQLQIIDFTGNRLTRLPYFIGRLVCANAILLGDNNLTVLPDSIGALGEVVLSTLNLSHNGLTRVPGALCNVLTLATVCLSGNALDELPSQMGRLANLKELWVDNNRLKLMPPTITGWEKIDHLLLHNNQLKMIPKNLPELTHLEVLTLSGNQLTSLPWDMWKLTKLQELWLDANQLERLPEGIERMPSLKAVSCKHNPFFKEEVERAERIMELFPDTDGAVRIQQAALAAEKEKERLAIAETTLLLEEDDPDDTKKRSPDDDLRDELELLQKELREALEQRDFENADNLQSLVDELEAKLAGAQETFARAPSAHEDSTTFTFRIEVLCCAGLVPSSKKAAIMNPYVSCFAKSNPYFVCLFRCCTFFNRKESHRIVVVVELIQWCCRWSWKCQKPATKNSSRRWKRRLRIHCMVKVSPLRVSRDGTASCWSRCIIRIFWRQTIRLDR